MLSCAQLAIAGTRGVLGGREADLHSTIMTVTRYVDVLDIDAGTMTTKHLKSSSRVRRTFAAISVAPDGRLWVLTEDHLWLWNAKNGRGVNCPRLRHRSISFEDVACDFATGSVVITAEVEKPGPDEAAWRVFFKRQRQRIPR